MGIRFFLFIFSEQDQYFCVGVVAVSYEEEKKKKKGRVITNRAPGPC
jgi:predicted ribosome-associated RNA-binding protein Tma20